MTYVRNYMTCGRSGSSGNITESPLGTLSLAAIPEDGQSEVFAQWTGIPIPEPGVWVIAARCRQATPPGSGVQNPRNGVLPVWSGNFVQMLNRGQEVVEAKNYAYEFTVPEGTETLTWRVCAPSGTGRFRDMGSPVHRSENRLAAAQGAGSRLVSRRHDANALDFGLGVAA